MTYSTSHVYVVQQPICSTTSTGGTLTNTPGYFQGIGGVQFVRIPDGQMNSSSHLLNPPIVTNYTMILFNPANGQWETRTFPARGDHSRTLFLALPIWPPGRRRVGGPLLAP